MQNFWFLATFYQLSGGDFSKMERKQNKTT